MIFINYDYMFNHFLFFYSTHFKNANYKHIFAYLHLNIITISQEIKIYFYSCMHNFILFCKFLMQKSIFFSLFLCMHYFLILLLSALFYLLGERAASFKAIQRYFGELLFFVMKTTITTT